MKPLPLFVLYATIVVSAIVGLHQLLHFIF